ncbi:MAG: hypothetical protein IH957_13390, partial [Chloroflexi bacterium]|nr:hypothetical protein [Chloroflexota bacterium]
MASSSFVVAVSSAAGGGKTTLVMKAGELLGATTLFFDDYRDASSYPQDLNLWKTPKFAEDLAALKRGERIVSPVGGATISPTEFIVIEEPMGRGRDEMATSVDFVVLIDTPLDIAMARRFLRLADTNPLADIEQTTKEQLQEHVEGLLGFVTGELRNYLDGWRAVYIAVQEQVTADCDLVLDGRLPPDELAEQLVEAV